MRVVLVDPSRTVLKFVSRLLEARTHDVRAFVDEGRALEYIKSDINVDALITSAELAGMSGIELCWEARLLASHRRQIYVIMMSSNQDRRRLAEALDGGADDFIGKPPVPEELYARLRAAERLASMQHELMRLATTDPLTGVLNRRAFFELAQEARLRAASGNTLCAIMFDIDCFKRINDAHGHDVGDEAIRAVARAAALESGIAGRSSLGRLGGEEFAVLVEGRSLAETHAIAERMRMRMGALRFETPEGIISLSCSFGVSELEAGDTVDLMLKRADLALYRAKAAGRNRVRVCDDLPASAPGRASSVIRTRARVSQ